jgi:hypothetical protein
MNHLERFNAVMNFQPVDRLPRIEWASWWDQTIERWRGEGLPAGDRYELYRQLGLDVYYQHWFAPKAESFPRPPSHGAGVVASNDDYERIKPHMFPPLEHLRPRLEQFAAEQDAGQAVMWITLWGFFWGPRSLLGIERHFYAFYDQPELMHRMNRDLADYNISILKWLGTFCRPAFMTFAEDMSYNHGPMLSRGQFEEFLLPYYRQVVPLLQEMGTRVLVDTDGDVTAMVPWLESAGIEGVLPLERQAGVDANAMRRQFPRFLMIGHYDKMVMPRGEAAMRAEFERLLPAMRSGGFIPSVDHQTPPGVSLDQYRTYLRLLEEYAAKV